MFAPIKENVHVGKNPIFDYTFKKKESKKANKVVFTDLELLELNKLRDKGQYKREVKCKLIIGINIM